MKDFRVAKCLDSNGINEYAIFSDGSRKKLIQNDEKYGKYFEVDNELNTDCTSLLRHSFTGRLTYSPAYALRAKRRGILYV